MRSESILRRTFAHSEFFSFKMGHDFGLNAEIYRRSKMILDEIKTLSCSVEYLHNVFLNGDWGYLTDESNFELTEQMKSFGWGEKHLIQSRGKLIDLKFKGEKSIDEPAINLLWPGVFTYGHWLLDMIPRLSFLVQAGIELERVTALLPKNGGKYMKYILSAFGIERFYEVASEERIFFSNLLSCTSMRYKHFCGVEFHRRAFSDFSRNFSKKFSIPNISDFDTNDGHIYVVHTPQTSKKNDPRVLENEADIVSFYETKNYGIINPLDFDFQKQFAIFSKSTILSGVDSSALHNAIFSTPHLFNKLIVLCPPWRLNLNHSLIASVLDAELLMVPGISNSDMGNFYVSPASLAGHI